MPTIYLQDADDRPIGNLTITSTPQNPEPIGLQASYYAAQGIGFGFDLTLTVEQARAVADLLRDAADALAAARELPDNATVVETMDRR